MNSFKTIMKWLNRINAWIGGALVFLIALWLLIGLIARYFARPILWTTEFTTYAMIAIVFLGFSICEEKGGHVRVEMITTRLNNRWWQISNIFALVTALGISTFLFRASLLEALHSLAEREMTTGLVLIPVYPAKLILAFGILLYSLQVLINLIEEIKHPSIKPTDAEIIVADDKASC